MFNKDALFEQVSEGVVAEVEPGSTDLYLTAVDFGDWWIIVEHLTFVAGVTHTHTHSSCEIAILAYAVCSARSMCS